MSDKKDVPKPKNKFDVHTVHATPLEQAFTDVATVVKTKPKWVVENILPPGLIIVGAPPKEGKSTIVNALAMVVAGHQVKALPKSMRKCSQPGRALIFSLEASNSEVKYTLEDGLGLKLKAPSNFMVCDDPWLWRLDGPGADERFLAWCEKAEARIVVIDPLRNVHDLDENDSAHMIQLLSPLRAWAVAHDASIVVVHHTKKPQPGQAGGNDPSALRGSGSIFGVADGVVMFSREGGDGSDLYSVLATFKRHPGYAGKFTFAAWHGGEGRDVLSVRDDNVLKLYREGADGAEIAKQLRLTPQQVAGVFRTLKRAGRIK